MGTFRQKIPIKLRRRILIEARHRCAICIETTVQVHHIIPWSECRRHEYSDLIAICPNCHDRVHREFIDRQALFEYKSRVIVSNKQFHILIDQNNLFDLKWGPVSHSPEERSALIVNLEKRKMLAGCIANINWPLVRCDFCECIVPVDNCCTPQEDCIFCSDEKVGLYCEFGCADHYQSLMRDFMEQQPDKGIDYSQEYMLQNTVQILEMTANQNY